MSDLDLASRLYSNSNMNQEAPTVTRSTPDDDAAARLFTSMKPQQPAKTQPQAQKPQAQPQQSQEQPKATTTEGDEGELLSYEAYSQKHDEALAELGETWRAESEETFSAEEIELSRSMLPHLDSELVTFLSENPYGNAPMIIRSLNNIAKEIRGY